MDSKFVLSVIVALMITLGTGTMVFASYHPSRELLIFNDPTNTIFVGPEHAKRAPVVVSGDNMYVTWFTNESTVNSNYEVGFRASNDSGATFGPITNISNTDNSDSINAEIAAEGGNVIVSWWERN